MRPQGLVMIEMAMPSLADYIRSLVQTSTASQAELAVLWRLLSTTVHMCRDANPMSDAHWSGLLMAFNRVLHWLNTAA